MISVDRLSRAAREDDEGWETVVIAWGDCGNEGIWIGESLLRM